MTDIAEVIASITSADDRRIPLPGTLNLRDIGGYPADGGVTRWRTLLRSDALHRLAPASAAELAALGLRTVLDLRTDIETQIAPTPLDELTSADSAGRHLSILGEDLTELPADLGEIYDFLIDNRSGQLGAAVTVLARPGALPALVHCTAGKDRTGLVIALTLATLGVPDHIIAADYALSGAYLDPRLTPAIGQLTESFGLADELAEALLASPPELILRALDRARTIGGSVDGYLRRNGVLETELDRLRAGLIDVDGVPSSALPD